VILHQDGVSFLEKKTPSSTSVSLTDFKNAENLLIQIQNKTAFTC
jgi:hypothetical protein